MTGITTSAPYLSVVLTGRNDDYGGDFNARFFRALRFNHTHLAAAGIDHEFVFVEWAPIDGQCYLVDVLQERLPDLMPTVRAYVVDARYQAACSLNPKLRFMEFLAKNVGIRRARGAFVLATNTDIHLSRGVVQTLAAQALDDGVLYRATRVDLKLGADLTHVDWPLLEDTRNHASFKTIRPPLFTGGSGDFQLLDRRSWARLRGFNEIYRVARVGIDANFCAKVYANGYRIQDIGAPVYHLNHVGSYRTSKMLFQDRPADAPWGRDWNTGIIYDNPEGWGLAEAPTRPLRDGLAYLGFTPRAVPPLLDLHRVLVPAARAGRDFPGAESERHLQPAPLAPSQRGA